MAPLQTFLPHPEFERTAKVLDYKRLGKQRSEALTIIRAIEEGNGWENHPVVKMWTGYTEALKVYHDEIIREWIDRGYDNNMDLYRVEGSVDFPAWLGDERLHQSHKSNLLRKEPEFYSQYDWDISPDLDYFWPTEEDYEVKGQD